MGTYTLAPAATSPLIGAGGQCTNPTVAGDPVLTVDQRGFLRPAACDIGAFQTQPIQVTGAPAITGPAAVGQTLTCSTGTFAATGDGDLTASGSVGTQAITYAWTSAGSQVATTSTYKVASGGAGHSITCTETATGAYGKGSATSPAVQIPAAKTSVGVKLSAVTQSNRSWSETKLKRKHKVPVGTAFKFTLNETATVKLTFTTTIKGRKVKHKCVTQTKHNMRDKKCTAPVAAGTLTAKGHAGANTVRFAGRIGKHRLTPGKYKLTITATSGKTTSTRTLSFTIVG